MTQPVTFAAASRILLSVDELDFAALYERHARDVYRFSLYLSGNFALAEDITAETSTCASGSRFS
jgi:DNA-directed RNA polymerase specialized sigma24 family protein